MNSLPKKFLLPNKTYKASSPLGTKYKAISFLLDSDSNNIAKLDTNKLKVVIALLEVNKILCNTHKRVLLRTTYKVRCAQENE